MQSGSASARGKSTHPSLASSLTGTTSRAVRGVFLGQFHDKVLPANLREHDAGSPGAFFARGYVDLGPRESLDLLSRRELGRTTRVLGQPLRCASNKVWKERVRRRVNEADVDRALPHVTGQTSYAGSMVSLSEGLARLVLGAGPGGSRSALAGPEPCDRATSYD